MSPKAIIIGARCFCPPGEHYPWGDWCCLPLHCFTKAFRIDEANNITAIALKVPTFRIRELEIDGELLDLDVVAQ
jgi:hypothetical protein